MTGIMNLNYTSRNIGKKTSDL